MSAPFTSLLVSVILLLSVGSSWASCVFMPGDHGECIAQYICSGAIDDFSGEIERWGCRRPINPRNYFNNHTFTFLPFSVKVEINDLHDDSDFSKFYRFSNYIQSVSVKNGNLTRIPSELLLYLENLSLLDVSYNTINRIRLQSILGAGRLQTFNASYNNISEFEALPTNSETSSRYEYRSRYRRLSSPNLNLIDLSHNAIAVITDSYFSQFNNLLHLNLSHNMIRSFTILTFEGVADLETLDLSHNIIESIDMNLARFYNLKELTLDYNKLTAVNENNFKVMTKLTKLDLSHNKIISIDDHSFQNMVGLQNVKLSDNNLETVPKLMFINNNNLRVLDLSNNHIRKIESFTFKGKYILELNLRHNDISSLADKYLFAGINTEKLDLSCNGITSLGPDLFSELHLELQSVNLSSNAIESIHENAFRSLSFLTYLDLSKNKLKKFDFDKSDLNNLLVFNAGSNFIEKITNDTFKNLRSLKGIDLSYNNITDLGLLSFNNLNHLETLDLSNNYLSSIITSQIFRGLSSTMALNLTHSKISTLQGGAFDGMISLTYLNVSFSELRVIDYCAFNNTGLIIFLDFSHNLLENFLVNNTELKYLTELYLSDNKIRSVTNETFLGLNKLQILDLDNNDILQIDKSAFHSLYGVANLILSSNVDMVLDSSTFSNFSSLIEVSLRNVWKSFSFESTQNTSILNLDLSSCNITDVNTIKLFKIRKLEKVSLTSNKIRFIDKHSFQNLSTLLVLDVSNNLISDIQPGSFASTTEIYLLNLSNNNLSSLPFGVFDGLGNLQFLNLSFNALNYFKGNVFHNSHSLVVISLDNNMIENIDFHEINSARIPKVTIGGNVIPCDVLAKAKKENYYGVVVTTEIKQFHTENIDGISCRGLKSESTPIQQNEIGAPAKMIDNAEVDNPSNPYSKIVINKLGDLTSAVYFETSCLVIIVGLLLIVISVRYLKFRTKLTRSYSLNSRRNLTGSAMDIELY